MKRQMITRVLCTLITLLCSSSALAGTSSVYTMRELVNELRDEEWTVNSEQGRDGLGLDRAPRYFLLVASRSGGNLRQNLPAIR